MVESGKVVAVCTSRNMGERKTPTDLAELQVEHGIIGDAHAGPWHRQVSLLAIESIAKMQALGLDVRPETLPRISQHRESNCQRFQSGPG